MAYYIFIKSHTDYPDYEAEIEANSLDKAVEQFYQMLHGEFDKEFIRENIASEDDIKIDN